MDLTYLPTERPEWRISEVKTSVMITRILGYRDTYYELSKEERTWACTVYYEQELAKYIYEVNKGDGEQGFQTYEETLEAINRARVIERFVEVPQDDSKLESIRCVYRAFICTRRMQELTTDKLKELYYLLCGSTDKQLAGCFRGKENEDEEECWSVAGSEVPARLEKLLEVLNDKLMLTHDTKKGTSNRVQVSYMLRLAASFLQRFEHIKPFKTGNRKCARIVIAALLQNIFPFPNVLFDDKIDDYLGIELDKKGDTTFRPPRELSAHLIEEVYYGWERFLDAIDSRVEGGFNSRKRSRASFENERPPKPSRR